MDCSERLGAVLALQQEVCVSDARQGCDLLLSAFASALKSSRRASGKRYYCEERLVHVVQVTESIQSSDYKVRWPHVPHTLSAAVCRPFPNHLLKHQQHRNPAAELDQLLQLPMTEAALEATTDLQLQLLQWLFLHMQLKRGFSLTPISIAQLAAELTADGCCLNDLSQLSSCHCILRVDNTSSSSPHSTVITGPKLAAYHGTDYCNMHSILHNGLLAASGTRLQSTGAVFGSGIYLAQDFNVAYSFCRPREGWFGSSIGKHLRCVLLCYVNTDTALQGSGVALSAADRWAQQYECAAVQCEHQLCQLWQVVGLCYCSGYQSDSCA